MARKRGLLGAIFSGLLKGLKKPYKPRESLHAAQLRQQRAFRRKKVSVPRFGKRR